MIPGSHGNPVPNLSLLFTDCVTLPKQQTPPPLSSPNSEETQEEISVYGQLSNGNYSHSGSSYLPFTTYRNTCTCKVT